MVVAENIQGNSAAGSGVGTTLDIGKQLVRDMNISLVYPKTAFAGLAPF